MKLLYKHTALLLTLRRRTPLHMRDLEPTRRAFLRTHETTRKAAPVEGEARPAMPKKKLPADE